MGRLSRTNYHVKFTCIQSRAIKCAVNRQLTWSNVMQNKISFTRALLFAIPICTTWASTQASTLEADSAKKSNYVRFFVSGHSLTDNPYGNYLLGLFKSAGSKAHWNQQMILGSPIRVRTRGMQYDSNWTGYRQGKNGNGDYHVDVNREFSAGSQRPYTHMVIAEANDAVLTVMANETPRYLRHFHEKFMAHNPGAQTYLFHPWEFIKDKSNPKDWIALETNARTIWSCVSQRINNSLKQEKRADRIRDLPIGHALAVLLKETTSSKEQPWSGMNTRQIVNRFFVDEVHLSNLGKYYAAQVTYTTITGKHPKGTWAPSYISAAVKTYLQNAAWNFYRSEVQNKPPVTMPRCRQYLVNTFCAQWDAYLDEHQLTNSCRSYFSSTSELPRGEDPPNPFIVPSAKNDAAYWFTTN